MKKIFAAWILVAVSGSAFANSACDKPHNDFDGLYCLNKVYQQADIDLNKAYASLGTKLDDRGKAAIKQGQLHWMSERNATCSRHDESGFLVNLQCATDTTIKRT